jgi:hypothetical protein
VIGVLFHLLSTAAKLGYWSSISIILVQSTNN